MENNFNFEPVLAFSDVMGSEAYPEINGRVVFKKKGNGVLVTAEIMGLPGGEDECSERVFGFHIHEGGSCTGNEEDPFLDAGMHYNPEGCEHPKHAGDLPSLFGNNGYAYMSVYTDRFNISDIIGKTVIIHSMPDDFTSQPSGNSGTKMACGIVVAL